MSSLPAPRSDETPLRVLLADDDEIVRCVLVEQLQQEGFIVHAVCDGTEVLDALAETSRYDVVLLDCQMPRMDGYTAAMHIRRREQQLGKRSMPIIAVTAYASRGERSMVIAAGMDDYVTKPLRMPELLDAIAAQRADREQEPLADVRRADSQAPLDRRTVESLRAPVASRRPDFFPKLVASFLAQATTRCAELEQALSRADLTSVADIAHAWKGGSRTIGALRLGDACERMEAAARAGDMDATRKWFTRVSTHLPDVIAALRGAS